jgi:hypothetical protein
MSLCWYYILDVPAFELNGSIFIFLRVVFTISRVVNYLKTGDRLTKI